MIRPTRGPCTVCGPCSSKKTTNNGGEYESRDFEIYILSVLPSTDQARCGGLAKKHRFIRTDASVETSSMKVRRELRAIGSRPAVAERRGAVAPPQRGPTSVGALWQGAARHWCLEVHYLIFAWSPGLPQKRRMAVPVAYCHAKPSLPLKREHV